MFFREPCIHKTDSDLPRYKMKWNLPNQTAQQVIHCSKNAIKELLMFDQVTKLNNELIYLTRKVHYFKHDYHCADQKPLTTDKKEYVPSSDLFNGTHLRKLICQQSTI